MTRVLFVFNGTPHTGGTEAVMMNYFEHLDRQKYSVDFVFHGRAEDCREHPYCRRLLEGGARLFFVTPRSESFFGNRRELLRLLRENSYDIVHCHMDAAAAFVLPLAKKAGVPVRAAHSHSTDNQINKGSRLKNTAYRLVLNAAARRVSRQANLRLACSEDAGRWLFGKSSFTVINNGIDCAAFAFSPTKREQLRRELSLGDRLVIGNVGRLCAAKNQQRLLDIFRLLHSRVPESVLVLTGDGEDAERLSQRAAKQLPDGSVRLTGALEDVTGLLSAFDVFVMPSLFEGLGLAAIEAQASGLPCVLSDGFPQLVAVTELVSFCPLEASDEEWCEKIISASKLERISTAQALAAAGFDSAQAVKSLELAYEKALSEI